MSPKNPRLHHAGLTALGLFALSPLGAAADSPPAAAPPAPVATVAPAPVHSVLLLTNGKLHQGLVSDGGTVYYLHGRGGKIPIPKRSVEVVGRSVRDIFEYKLGRLPERDPDEHMKLALWCLTHQMTDEAKDQLKKVVVLSPKDHRALAMLDKIGGAEERAAQRDPAVAQAGVEMAAGRPEVLDPAVLGRAQRQLGISTLPEIPGLPTAQAVKRSNEFRQFVEPVLQFRCAKCHNEQFEGNFRLVKYRTRQDRTPDALRANLDAVLRLIDWDDPVKSELLSSTLRPHGTGAAQQPIFAGSNNREYKVLYTWVRSLRPQQPVAAATAPRLGGSAGTAAPVPEGEGFGAQRPGALPLPLTPTPPSTAVDTRPPLPVAPAPATPRPPGQYLPGSAVGTQPYAPPDTEFPAPYMVGGPRPTKPVQAPGTEPPPPPLPGAAAPAAAATPPGAGGAQPAAGGAGAAAPAPKPKGKGKAPKIDPALLEKALMNRYAPPQ